MLFFPQSGPSCRGALFTPCQIHTGFDPVQGSNDSEKVKKASFNRRNISKEMSKRINCYI